MIYKRYSLFCVLLLAGTILPIVNEKGFSLMPSVMAQSVDTKEAERFLKMCRENLGNDQAEAAIQSCQQAVTAHQQIKDLSGEAKSTVNLGIAYNRSGQYSQAISVLENAVKITRESKERRVEALAFINLGIAYGASGQSKQSIEFLQQALTIAQEIKDVELEKALRQNLAEAEKPPASRQEKEADRFLQQGIQQYQTSQFREALQSWEQALQIYREIKNRQGEANALVNLGASYYYLGQYQKAIDYEQQSLAIAKEIGDRQGEANALVNLGELYHSLGQYPKAIDYEKQSLVIAREIGDRQVEAKALVNLGLAYFSQGNYPKAIEYEKQSLGIAREIGDRGTEAKSLGNIGIAYSSLGQYQKAIEYHQQSLAIAREIGDHQWEASCLSNLGLAYFLLGKYQKAIDYQQQSLAIGRKISDRGSEAKILNSLGNAYYSLGQYQKALDYHQQSLAIAKEIGDRGTEAKTLDSLGNAYYFLGQYQKAICYKKQSLAIAREIGDRQGEATSLGNLGVAYTSLGQYKEAIKYHQQSLAIAREIGDRYVEAASLGSLGSAYDSLGQYQKAIKYHQQSLAIAREIGDRQGEATSLGNLGVAYTSLGQYQKAIEYLQQYLAIATEIRDRFGEALILNDLGLEYRDNHQPKEAIKNLEASLKIYLEIRSGLLRDNRKKFLATNERTVITLAEVLIQQNQPEKAFQWLNLATTNDLINYDLLINAKIANPEAQKAKDDWQTNNQQLEGMRRQQEENIRQGKYSIELAKQINEIQAQANTKAETIAQTYPEVAELFETKLTDIAQLQKNIAPDTLVIQPVPLRDKIALFLLTKDKLTVIESNTKADQFNQLVNQYRNQLADRLNSDYLDTSSQLYDILIRPIEQQIKTNSPNNLAIIATDQLRYIPFESLYDAKTDQYLLQKYPISYLTRISTANVPKSPATTAKNLQVLALANPKPTNQELKGTEKEAENLLKIFPQSETYLGEKATLDTFKTQASRFPILHLGTHGCFELAGCPNLKMEANTILFANNQQYNIADAALLGLKNTELITLSACQTAKEANANGQEISGLAYVLERAGAKSVIASLWNADDNTSAEIMTQFYQNLQKGMTKSEALQKAKLSQIQENPKPFFWSPFILIGDAQ